MNGAPITDWTDRANHLPGGAEEGMIGVQVYRGNRCKPGLYHRYRNLGVELP
jgi:hypothetical protein